jgi:small-conductance mechanosensitive channel
MGKVKEYLFRKRTTKQLSNIQSYLRYLTKEINKMSVELDELIVQVAETQSVEESVIIILDGIKAQIDALIAELELEKVDTAKLVELRDNLDASEQALAAAAAEFTPPVP